MIPRAAVRTTLMLLLGTATLAQTPAPPLRIVEPTGETVLTGESTLSVEPPPGRAVAQVVFQVDGVEACRITMPPFTCRWNAGPVVRARVVRAAATFADGGRLVATVRTRDLGFAQTSSVASVLVATHVTDDRGRFVPGLRATDFTILDAGVPQNVELVGTDAVGAELVMAVDASQSMEPNMADLRLVVRNFLQALRPVDRVTLGVFNTGLLLIAEPDASPAARLAALDKVEAFGATALYDTMIEAADLLRSRPGKRALVVFTDGDDVNSRASAESARIALQEHDVLLYFVATGKAADTPALRASLTGIAIETGGAAYFEARLRNTSSRFSEIVSDLSSQYLLSFSPTLAAGDTKWHPLTVRTKDPRLRVRARQGYFAKGR